MSKPRSRTGQMQVGTGYETSMVRTGLVVLLVVLGIVWVAVYLTVAKDAATWSPALGLKKPADPLPWMSALKSWNFAIGFGLIILGLFLSADPRTPLGRGRGVVIGMLGCFLLGLVWIVVYYFTSGGGTLPLIGSLGQWNLAVGIAFMAAGFGFATRWE